MARGEAKSVYCRTRDTATRLHLHHSAPWQRTEAVQVSKINLRNQSQSEPIKCRCGLFKQLRESKIEQDTVSDPRLVPVLVDLPTFVEGFQKLTAEFATHMLHCPPPASLSLSHWPGRLLQRMKQFG